VLGLPKTVRCSATARDSQKYAARPALPFVCKALRFHVARRRAFETLAQSLNCNRAAR
jgi:hypothetical protein